MGFLKRSVLCLGTFIIIAAGFFMPVFVSKGLNYHFYNSVEEMENKKISLDLSVSEEDIRNAWTFFNLTRLDPNASIVEISEQSKACRFTYDKIKTNSVRILEQLGISDYHYNDFEAVPNLFVSISDEIIARTAVYWRCSWTDENNMTQVMWIDDISGKLVGLVMNVNNMNGSIILKGESQDSADYSDSDIPKAVMTMVEYCKENYQADDIRCRKEMDGNYIIEMMNQDNDNAMFISVYLDDKNLFFNI
ncbi:MAG: hypothetical protein K2J59_07310 [Eubacterium sp.]|nr:hypothetical protein [Eubacterium sp.]